MFGFNANEGTVAAACRDNTESLLFSTIRESIDSDNSNLLKGVLASFGMYRDGENPLETAINTLKCVMISFVFAQISEDGPPPQRLIAEMLGVLELFKKDPELLARIRQELSDAQAQQDYA